MKCKSIISAILSLTMLFSISTIASAEQIMLSSSKEAEVIDQHYGDSSYGVSLEDEGKFISPYPGETPNENSRVAINDNTFYIRNKRTGQYLTADSSNNAVVANYTGASNQKWQLTNVDGTFFKLRPLSAGSTYFLDVDGSYNANEASNTYLQNGTNVKLFNNGSTNYHSSQWAAMYCEGGSYLVVAKMSYVYNGVYYGWQKNKYLSCIAGSNNVVQYESLGIDNGSNHWYFEPVNSQPWRGNLDSVSSTAISGWAYNPNTPNNPINVRIVIASRTSGKVVLDDMITANGYRADVAAAGFGTGYYGFTYSIDWSKFKSDEYKVQAYAHGANEISGSPKYYTHQGPENHYHNVGWSYVFRTANYYINAPYGKTSYYLGDTFHTGLDIDAATGTAVYAVDNGVVKASAWDNKVGNYIVIEVNDTVYGSNQKLRISYFHLNSRNVSVNQTVTASTLIGYSGSTGTSSTGPHLHISVITNGAIAATKDNTIDPAWCFPNVPFTGHI